jgi:hypothetical protein
LCSLFKCARKGRRDTPPAVQFDLQLYYLAFLAELARPPVLRMGEANF